MLYHGGSRIRITWDNWDKLGDNFAIGTQNGMLCYQSAVQATAFLF